MKSRALVASLIVWVCSLVLAALLSPSSGRASSGSNLLQNPGFEEGTVPWRPDHSTTDFITVTEPVHSGGWAASLNKEVGTGLIYIYQDVPVVGGFRYRLSGWAYNYKDIPMGDWAMLRIEWRDAWEEISRVDSHILTDDEDTYHFLCIPKECNGDGALAPNNAVKARIECVAHIQEPNPETPVFFDDLSFTFQGSKVYLPLVVKNY